MKNFLHRNMTALIATLMMALAMSVALFGLAPTYAAEQRAMIFSKTYDPASVATAVQTSTTVPAPGAILGDTCTTSFSLDQALVDFTCYISAAGTATVLVKNGTAGTIDLASGTVRVFIYPRGAR